MELSSLKEIYIIILDENIHYDNDDISIISYTRNSSVDTRIQKY